MANFNIHASRRFGAAETVYAKVRIAHGAVVGLFGVAQVPTFEEYNRADLNGYLESRDVPEGMRLRILGLWDNNRQEALGLLRDYLRRLDVAESQNELSAAQNEAFLNELYLSDEATAALQELFSMLWDWIYVAQNPDHGQRRQYEREEIQASLEAVRGLLRDELAAAKQVAPSTGADKQLPPAT